MWSLGEMGRGYFVVKTALPTSISYKKIVQIAKSPKNTVSDFPPDQNSESPKVQKPAL